MTSTMSRPPDSSCQRQQPSGVLVNKHKHMYFLASLEEESRTIKEITASLFPKCPTKCGFQFTDSIFHGTLMKDNKAEEYKNIILKYWSGSNNWLARAVYQIRGCWRIPISGGRHFAAIKKAFLMGRKTWWRMILCFHVHAASASLCASAMGILWLAMFCCSIFFSASNCAFVLTMTKPSVSNLGLSL